MNTKFQASFRDNTTAQFQQVEYEVPELVRHGDAVQIDHPCGQRLVASLPADAEPKTKIVISVPASSVPFPVPVAVRGEALVGGKIGGIPFSTHTSMKTVVWQENSEACSVCKKHFGFMHLRRHHHCRVCGKNVCSRCSPARQCVPGYIQDQRVCLNCVEESNPSPVAVMVTSTTNLV